MAKIKLDGVIEAVRYTPEGQISLVRAFKRQGAVWSDRILLDRKGLSDWLASGKYLVVGQRRAYLGGSFTTGAAIQQVKAEISTKGQASGRDLLAGIPVF